MEFVIEIKMESIHAFAMTHLTSHLAVMVNTRQTNCKYFEELVLGSHDVNFFLLFN